MEAPIVYTADPTSCRGARHLALDQDTEHVVTLRQVSGTWAYEEATSGFVPWEAALGSQPPSGAPGGRLWPDVGAAQQSGLRTIGDNRITGDRRGFRAGGRPVPPHDSKEGGSSFLTSPPPLPPSPPPRVYVAGFTAIVGKLGEHLTVAAFRLAPSPHWHYCSPGRCACEVEVPE